MVLTTSTGRPSPRRRLRRLAVAVALPATLAGATLLSAPAALADVPTGPGSLTVHYSDGAVDWTVPTGTYQISVTAIGGSGSDGNDIDFQIGLPTGGTPGTGGMGAVVTASVPVVPGEHLHLEPGSAGQPAGVDTVHSNGGRTTGPFAPGGTGTFGLLGTGSGGGGGAATVVRSDSVLLAVAGGGGGGAGTGIARDGGSGGDAGATGSTAPGAGGGLGGNGFLPAGPDPLGSGGNSHLAQAVLDGDAQAAGGGGGGGGGWDGSSRGGGIGGEEGVGDAGGGGGAGGLSFAVDPAATIGVASSPGDGWVQLDWTPGVRPTSTLTAPDSVDQGTAVTLTDTLAAPRAGLPAPTGTVTFEQLDPATQARTVLGTADVTDGQARISRALAGTGAQAVHAIYSGDGTYFASTSDYVFTTVAATALPAPVVTRVSPSSGPRKGGTVVTITGRNFTGVTAIRIGAATMTSVTCPSSTTCTAITPRGTHTRAIRVVTAAGRSPFTRADRFTYR
jgi:hypothetical protein